MDICSNFMTAILTMTISIFLLFTGGGCSKKEDPWPPSPPSTKPVTSSPEKTLNFGSGAGGQGWDYVYEDANGTVSGWGPLAVEGEIELPFNVFMIDSPGEGYAQNSYEVVYHDKERTGVRLLREKHDKVVIIDSGSMNFTGTFTHVGTKVRCGDRTYEICGDGWYLNGRLVHAFTASKQEGKPEKKR